MAFLSALATPIARRVEVWRPDARREQLLRSSGFCEGEGSLGASSVGVARGEGSIGQAFLTGVPALATPGTESAGGMALAAIPVVLHGRLTAVLAIYF